MPYEATVPVHRRLLWPAVTDAERLIGALPNASIDASGAQGVAGRLRVRTREQTVTFRGVARIVEVVPSSLRVSLEIEAVFGRAGGTVDGLVEIALRQAGTGTRVVVGGQLDIAPGAAPLSTEALDSAFKRVVQRWFTALAETSPAGKPSPGELSERADESSAQQAEARQSDDLPHRRTSERAPLAVVRDLNAERESAGNGSAAPAQPPQTPAAEPQDSNASNGWPKQTEHEPDDEAAPAAPEPPRVEPKPHAPVPLRLVPPEPDAKDDGSNLGSSAAYDAENALAPVDPGEPAELEPDDIWSRLRDRSLPPWIPFLIGVGTASLATLVFVFAALRRRYRR